jgi:HSP20 family molecular chaperone IbpA
MLRSFERVKNIYIKRNARSRAIPLPFDPDPAKVEAKFDKGVLHVHLPKPAEVAEG